MLWSVGQTIYRPVIVELPTSAKASLGFAREMYVCTLTGDRGKWKRRLGLHCLRHRRSNPSLNHPESCLSSWANRRFSPWRPPWAPAADCRGVYFADQPIPIFFKTRRSTWTRSFQVRCAVMSFVLIVSVGWSKHLPLISSLASNRYEC